jgi:hypothetical protein
MCPDLQPPTRSPHLPATIAHLGGYMLKISPGYKAAARVEYPVQSEDEEEEEEEEEEGVSAK